MDWENIAQRLIAFPVANGRCAPQHIRLHHTMLQPNATFETPQATQAERILHQEWRVQACVAHGMSVLVQPAHAREMHPV